MWVVDCPVCGAIAGIGANTDQLIEQKINKSTLVQGHCSACGTTRTISVIDSNYYEQKVLPMYWKDEDELIEPLPHEHDYQNPFRRTMNGQVVVVRTCTKCGREKHTRFGQRPESAPANLIQPPLTRFQRELYRVYVYPLKPSAATA